MFLQRRYKITLVEYNSLLDSQGGVCAICLQEETRITRPKASKYISKRSPRLVVDHDHLTGVVRGLLCAKCNIALGHLQDSLENIHRAAIYIERNQS